MPDRDEIERMRATIDEIDEALLRLIAQRRDIAIEIAKVKQKSGEQDDEKRLKEVFERVEKKAEELGLDKETMRELWKAMISYMIREQMRRYPY